MSEIRLLAGQAVSAFGLLKNAMWLPCFGFLVCVDLILIGLHFVLTGMSSHDDAPVSADWGRIDRDGSVSEIVEYAKLALSGCILFRICTLDRRQVFMPVAVVIFFLLADNAFGLHEHLALSLYPGHQNSGEFLFMGLAGLGFLGATAAGWLKATGAERIEMLAIGMAVGLLGMFAAGVDAVHVVAIRPYPLLDRPLALLEDGGELVALSVLLAACLHILMAHRKGGPRFAAGLRLGGLKPLT